MKIATQKQKSWKLLAYTQKKTTTPAVSCEAAQLSVPVLKKCACCVQEFSIRCVRICYLTPVVCFGFVCFCFALFFSLYLYSALPDSGLLDIMNDMELQNPNFRRSTEVPGA